jgi:hypothetical protein
MRFVPAALDNARARAERTVEWGDDEVAEELLQEPQEQDRNGEADDVGDGKRTLAVAQKEDEGGG